MAAAFSAPKATIQISRRGGQCPQTPARAGPAAASARRGRRSPSRRSSRQRHVPGRATRRDRPGRRRASPDRGEAACRRHRVSASDAARAASSAGIDGRHRLEHGAGSVEMCRSQCSCTAARSTPGRPVRRMRSSARKRSIADHGSASRASRGKTRGGHRSAGHRAAESPSAVDGISHRVGRTRRRPAQPPRQASCDASVPRAREATAAAPDRCAILAGRARGAGGQRARPCEWHWARITRASA